MKFTIQETVRYEIEAGSAPEALAIWLDKGEECAEFIAVDERDVLDENGEWCSTETEEEVSE